jgi:ethanolamine ammonia-lyase small subunit
MSESLHNRKSDITLATSLREHTPARVALTRTGSSISTRDALDFALCHAQARDAVHATLSLPSLIEALRSRNLEVITVKSAAPDRSTYLRRPDLGRTLSPQSATQLATNAGAPFMQPHRMSGPLREAQTALVRDSSTNPPKTLTIILADGLSALAVDRHAIPLLDALLPLLAPLPTPSWRLTPIVIAEQARVAIADPIGQALHADLTLLLIGERPGLSSPDSLGAYLTWAPRPGRTDAERNCVSNIRTQGLDYAPAAHRIATLANEARRLQLTGTTLKDLDPPPTLPST